MVLIVTGTTVIFLFSSIVMPFRNYLFFDLCTRATNRWQHCYEKEVDNVICIHLQVDVVSVCTVLTLAIAVAQLVLSVLQYRKK